MMVMSPLLLADSVGAVSSKPYIGKINRPLIHLTTAQVIEISDQLMREEIAEVDIDLSAFEEKEPSVEKKKSNDEIEFIK